MLIGVIIGFLPMVARNVAVGAAPLAQSTRSILTWAMANHVEAMGGGVYWNGPGPGFIEVMKRAGHSSIKVVSGVIGSYRGAWWTWLGRWGRRTLALGVGPEASDNTAYDYFRLRVPILAFCLDFRWLMPLGLAGLVLYGRRWRVAARHGSAPCAMLIYLLFMVAALSAVFPLGRYRLFLLPVLAPFGARALVVAWTASRRKIPVRLVMFLSLVVIFVCAQMGLGRLFSDLGRLRTADFILASRMLMQWGRPELAVEELKQAEDLRLSTPQLEVELALAVAQTHRIRGEHAAMLDQLAQAHALQPENPSILQTMALLRAAGNDPQIRDGRAALALVEQLAALPGIERLTILDLQAAGYAELGDFAEAERLAGQALQLARDQGRQSMADNIRERLELYRQGQPFRLGSAAEP